MSIKCNFQRGLRVSPSLAAELRASSRVNSLTLLGGVYTNPVTNFLPDNSAQPSPVRFMQTPLAGTSFICSLQSSYQRDAWDKLINWTVQMDYPSPVTNYCHKKMKLIFPWGKRKEKPLADFTVLCNNFLHWGAV